MGMKTEKNKNVRGLWEIFVCFVKKRLELTQDKGEQLKTILRK